jgi:uncharacterized protein YjgD (DUF1641 family)
MDKDLALLHEKVDQLTTQMLILTEQADVQQRRNHDFDELKADLIPIGNQLVNLAITELEEIGTEFALEDLLFLLKRVLRNTNLILTMMDRFEALMGIADEVDLLGKQVFSAAVEALDRLEQGGLFNQARDLFDTLSHSSTLADLNGALLALQLPADEEFSAPSLFSLIRELRKPETRTGMYRLVKVLQSLGTPARDK